MCPAVRPFVLPLAAVLTLVPALGNAQTPDAAPLPNAMASAAAPAPIMSVSTTLQSSPEEIGDALMGHQRYQAAIEAYKRVPAMRATTWNKMGVAYQLLFNDDAALRCYQRALKVDSKNAIAWNNIGSVYMEQRQYSTAVRAYRKAVSLDGTSALFHKNLGTAYLSQRKYKKGWQAYQAALADDPNIFNHSSGVRVQNPASLQDRGAMNYYLAKGCVRAGQIDRAIEYLRLALNEGFTTPKKVIADQEFAALRDLPEFHKLMAAQGMPSAEQPIHPPAQP